MYRRTITPGAPAAPREMGLCEYCSTPCPRDAHGEFACADACPTRPAAEPEKPRDFNREVHNFVIGEFRSHGAVV